jgi:mediator of RNA polymerase II transcription subunit 12
MPIFVQAKDLLQQRSLALYGDNEEIRKEAEAEEARDIKAAMEEIKEYVPEIFGWSEYGSCVGRV